MRDGEKVVGAVARDLESGEEIRIRATATINAAGVWTDEIQQMIGGKGQFRVRASKGVHIVVPRDRIDSDTGLITETEKSLLFIIPCPWSDDFWVIGTTDTPWDLDLAHPAASSADIDYILEHANALLAKPLTRDDVVGVYAGLRPLLAGESDETSKLSREHACVSPGPRAGDRGRRQVHDVPGDGQGRRRPRREGPRQARVGLPDRRRPAGRRRGLQGAARTPRTTLAARSGLPVERIEHLLGRYGSAVREVLELVAEHPELGEPLEHAPRYLKVEAYYGASHEGALHLDDLLARRLRVSVDTWDRGVDVAQRGRRDRRAGPGLGRRDDRARGRALPGPGGRRARLPGPARRQDSRLRTARGPRGPGRSRVSTT